ncbi:galactose-1-phosphate uridylyltransferase [Neocloeon triangulifer]|uniref:galactose-1-phosphate uridylyltransferase n=1 Tax=Neocloeon triangulifer TaxID=2078957 RepID=UPI00286EBA7D|nr:galactose-1-phosphate uridylyltransferase [Neocloeon triangulifer]
MSFNPTEHQHIRYNPLKDEWVLVSPHRMLRPWTGQVEKPDDKEGQNTADLNNPLCPGAKRSSGVVNPIYESTYTFTNDFPALLEEIPEPKDEGEADGLFRTKAAKGTCRVMCFHPRSDISIPLMSVEEITKVIQKWISETKELGEKYAWVQVFENKGATMGCSNPHPHCQIWASDFVPNEGRVKNENQLKYFQKKGKIMLGEYATQEIEKKERVVFANADWVVVVPYWAVWPFETMILPIPKESLPLPKRFTDLTTSQEKSLADAMKVITTKYDNLFLTSFPYSMGWHGAPTGKHLTENMDHWVFHGIYLPPLLRSATIKKFMVGYELLAQAQRDLTAEQAAERLRNCSSVHYKIQNKK